MKAIIDLGTNTFHLVIAEAKLGKVCTFYKLQVPVKIGQGGISNGFIAPEAYQRGLTTLIEFKKYIDQFEVTQIHAFATSAIRNAKNGNQFVKDVYQKSGIIVTTIDGDKEAEFIYAGVLNSFKFPQQNVLVMDIGGGSVEFIIGNGSNILWKQSFEIGASRLIENFHKQDPISDEEITALDNYLSQVLIPLYNAIHTHNPEVLIGSAGSFETLVDVVIKDLAVIPLSLSLNAFEIRREDFDVFVEIMRTSTHQQRTRLKGMTDFRVEMITVAAMLMQHVVSKAKPQRIIASNYSLKEGVLFTN